MIHNKYSSSWQEGTMAMVMFDTLRFAKELEESGVPVKQAEKQAELLKKVLEEQAINESQLEVKLSQLKNELIKWVLGIVLSTAIVQTGIIISCLRLVH